MERLTITALFLILTFRSNHAACRTLPSVDELVDALDLVPRNEGGWIRETWRSGARVHPPYGNRSALAAIYYVVQDQLNFHLPKFSETWSYYFGSDALTIYELDNSVDGSVRTTILGSNVMNGEVVQYTIKAGTWYAVQLNANAVGSYAFIGNQASPSFENEDWDTGNAAELFAEFPEAAGIISQLTFVGNSTRPTVNPEAHSCKLPTAEELRDLYGLLQHPEGGYFLETFRSATKVKAAQGERDAMTAIYYLMTSAKLGHSDFHRLQSDETWNFYFGETVYLYELDETVNGNLRTIILGHNITNGEVRQHSFKAGTWFGAEVNPNSASQGSYAFVGAIVGPGFEFSDWELGVRSDLVDRKLGKQFSN